MCTKEKKIDGKKTLELGKEAAASGRVADYIPELAGKNPNHVALAWTGPNGAAYEGDWTVTFSLQSITKVFALILALSRYGEEAVLHHVGLQGSAQPFNTLEGLDVPPYQAPNPMVNAGAITVTSLLGEQGSETIAAWMREMTGYEKFWIDDAVAQSEEKTGFRNFAIGYLLKSHGKITGEVPTVLRSYFRQCAISTDTKGLLLLAAWLAQGMPGWSPEAIDHARLRALVKSAMITGGLYDASTMFYADTGWAAKSGVGGGIMAFDDAGCAYVAFGPALDEQGNSAAGMAMLRELAAEKAMN